MCQIEVLASPNCKFFLENQERDLHDFTSLRTDSNGHSQSSIAVPLNYRLFGTRTARLDTRSILPTVNHTSTLMISRQSRNS